MKRVIIVVVLLLMLLAGIAAFLIMSNLVPQVLQPYLHFLPNSVTEPAPEEAPPPAPKTLLQMETLTIPLIRNGRLQGQIGFDLRLEIELSNSTRVNQEMVHLRDAYLKSLHEFLPGHMVGRRTADLQLVKGRLIKVSDKLLGKGVVLRILFDNVFIP